MIASMPNYGPTIAAVLIAAGLLLFAAYGLYERKTERPDADGMVSVLKETGR